MLAGAWGRLATLRDGVFGPADVDKLGGRGVRAIRVQGRRAVAAGQGGLVLLSQDSGGDRWGFADLRLPPEAAAGCDFDAVALVDQHVWVAGRPGSVVFHSADFGRTWEPQPTGQPLPLHALHFLDAKTAGRSASSAPSWHDRWRPHLDGPAPRRAAGGRAVRPRPAGRCGPGNASPRSGPTTAI